MNLKHRKIYLIGSLRFPGIQPIAEELRFRGHEVFDDWYAAGEKADDAWQAYEQERGRTYLEALNGVHAVATFNVDKERLNWADTAVMVLPAGRSCHMEFGYMRGQHKNCHILMTQEPDRYDLMYRFAHGIWCNMDDLAQALVEGNFNVEW